MTELSFPTEYSITGRSDSDAASRKIWMLSASRRWRWVRLGTRPFYQFSGKSTNNTVFTQSLSTRWTSSAVSAARRNPLGHWPSHLRREPASVVVVEEVDDGRGLLPEHDPADDGHVGVPMLLGGGGVALVDEIEQSALRPQPAPANGERSD